MQGSGQVGGLLPGDCCQPEASVRFTMTSCSADGSPWGFAQRHNPGVPAAAPPEGGTPHSSTGSWDGRWASPPAENWVTKNCHPPPHPTPRLIPPTLLRQHPSHELCSPPRRSPLPRYTMPYSRPCGVLYSTVKQTSFPISFFRRNSRAGNPQGWKERKESSGHQLPRGAPGAGTWC